MRGGAEDDSDSESEDEGEGESDADMSSDEEDEGEGEGGGDYGVHVGWLNAETGEYTAEEGLAGGGASALTAAAAKLEEEHLIHGMSLVFVQVRPRDTHTCERELTEQRLLLDR